MLPLGTKSLGVLDCGSWYTLLVFCFFLIKTFKEMTYNLSHICQIIDISQSGWMKSFIDYLLILAKVIPKQCPGAIFTVIWVGFSRVRLRCGGWNKITQPPSCVKHVRIMLEILNLVGKYTDIFSFRKYTFEYEDPLNFADGSIFFAKKQRFLTIIVPLLKSIVWQMR